MVSIEYRRRLELGSWEESIAVSDVCALTSLLELESTWDIAVWNMSTKIILHSMPGELCVQKVEETTD